MSSIPRVSIIVPQAAENDSFESTLVSVLENRPTGCEVLVAHDGHYRDPFALGDEVDFIDAGSTSLLEMIRAASDVARARFVHVVVPGCRVTPDWVNGALDQFEDLDVAAVAPTLMDGVTGRVASAGWEDTSARLFCPIAGGNESKKKAADVTGCYLQASFWRTAVLRSLLDCLGASISGMTAANYALGQLLQVGHWRVRSTGASRLVLDSAWSETTGAVRGRLLSAICNAITGETKPVSLVASAISALTGRNQFAETYGQATYSSQVTAVKRAISTDNLVTYDATNAVLKFPTHAQPIRRAA
ncbi:hypothetical protein [Stieleria varia]|uniref:Glycosyl transferase family 2 n=1 Tax=Stieleria varia TaxID=2528005 RepID=A0A5C6B7X5_9BACT|nr:hypothetical protein [Stieleria varia]TWU08058.1 hypothetical protein Pla52n_06390 [Stieleria varia]